MRPKKEKAKETGASSIDSARSLEVESQAHSVTGGSDSDRRRRKGRGGDGSHPTRSESSPLIDKKEKKEKKEISCLSQCCTRTRSTCHANGITQMPQRWLRGLSLVEWGLAVWLAFGDWILSHWHSQDESIVLRDRVFLVGYHVCLMLAMSTTHGFSLYRSLSDYPYDVDLNAEWEALENSYRKQEKLLEALKKQYEKSGDIDDVWKEKILGNAFSEYKELYEVFLYLRCKCPH